jgi:hypothetical protein
VALFVIRNADQSLAMMTKAVMPTFVFARRPDIEHEGGFLLAGILVVEADKRNMRLVEDIVEDIVQQLSERARSGVLGDELTVGWVGGHKPKKNAVDQYDGAALAAWARGCLKITVRVVPLADGQPRVYH